MIMRPLPAWIQELAVQHFTLEVIYTKAITFTPVFRLLLVFIARLSEY